MRRPAWEFLTTKLFSVFAVASMLATASAPARADDAASLLAKHKAFAGWSFGDGTYKALVTEWTVTDKKDGKVRERFTERAVGAIERTDYKLEPSGEEEHDGFTGKLYWGSYESGFTTRIVGDAAKFFVARNLVFEEAATGTNGTFEGVRSIDGKSYPVVRVKIDASLPVDLFIDESGAYRRFIIDPNGAYEATYDVLETSEPLAGKKIISKYLAFHRTYSLEKATANVTIANEDLRPPPPSASWTFGSGDPIPIKVTPRSMFLTATVNGVEGHFILDTGAGGIVLNAPFAARAHVEVIRPTAAVGIGGELKLEIARIKTFKIGDNTLSNAIVATSALDLDGEETGEGRDGLVGYGLLSGAIVDLSLDDGTLTLYDPAKVQPDTRAGIPLLVDLSTGVPMVSMKLNDRVDVRATLDSGNPGDVLFDRDLVLKHGVRFMTTGLGFVEGLGGSTDVECGRLQSLRLGPILYLAPPACMGYAVYGSSGSDRDVLVGFDLLKNFNIVFDYPEATFVLQRRKTAPR